MSVPTPRGHFLLDGLRQGLLRIEEKADDIGGDWRSQKSSTVLD